MESPLISTVDETEGGEEDVKVAGFGDDRLLSELPSCSSKRHCKFLMYSTAIRRVSTLDNFLLFALDVDPCEPSVLAPMLCATLCGMCERRVAKPLFTCLTRFLSRAFLLATDGG